MKICIFFNLVLFLELIYLKVDPEKFIVPSRNDILNNDALFLVT